MVPQTLNPDAVDPELPHCWIAGRRYALALTEAGGVPWAVPLLPDHPETIRAIYERLDAVFLCGGIDINPERYGEARRESLCQKPDLDRDAIEFALVEWALDDGKPILGVCRGMQLINVARGGTLIQDLPALRPESIKHDYFPKQGFVRNHLAHEMTVEPSSRIGSILGEPRVMVNSLHHQGVNRLGEGLAAVAFSPDGLVEGIEGTDSSFLIGVQWHPEELTGVDAGMKRLFERFALAAVDYREGRSAAV
jgi:putative glutamine amidotransferase